MKRHTSFILLFYILLSLSFSMPLLAEPSITTTNQTIPTVPAPIVCPAELLPGSTTYTGTVTSEISAIGKVHPTGELNVPHVNHAAARLSDGQVLIVGGSQSASSTKAEIYSPLLDTFTPTGNLNQPRNNHTATLLLDGRVLIAGSSYNNSSTTAELYDPAFGIFTPTGNLNQARDGHTATLLADGSVLIVGGNETTRAEIYSPSLGTFTRTGNLNHRRNNHTATLLADGRVLIVGGSASSITAEIYSPSLGTFTRTGNLNHGRSNHTATLLWDGRVLIVGGRDQNTTAEIYSPSQGTFTRTDNLNQPRNNHTATLLADGRVLIMGSSIISSSRAPEVYDPWLNTFSPLPNLGKQRSNHTTTFLVDERVLIVGGDTNSTNAEIYTPPYLSSTNTFSATLIVPSAWESIQSSIVVTLTGVTTGTNIHSGSIVNGLSWNPWIEMQPGIPVTTTFYSRFDEQTGMKSILLRLQDQNLFPDQQPIVIEITSSDNEPPIGGRIVINNGALATTTSAVFVNWEWPIDNFCFIKSIRFSNDGLTWGSWNNTGNLTEVLYTLPQGDGEKQVYAQFRDFAGNVSRAVSDTIQLDTSVGSESLLSINQGAIWTNGTSVTLTIGAPAYTTQMQISNDGGFANAVWQPFDSRPSWEIIPYGSYAFPRTVYVRVRGNNTNPGAPYSDDIILDPIAPEGTITIQSVSASTVTVALEARDPDNLSGVAQMRVALHKNFAQSTWEPFSANKVLSISDADTEMIIYAKFKDGAGNETGIISTSTKRSFALYLPMTDK